MEAIVLAGGYGTRLRDVVADVPKPMAPVCGRPFLRFVLDDLHVQGCDAVVLAVGYLHEQISDYFGDTYKGMRLSYSIEEEPLGTGGAIKQALSHCTEEIVLVLHGDTFLETDLTRLLEEAAESGAQATLSAKRLQDFDRYGSLEVVDNTIISFHEKEYRAEGLINGGIYAVRRHAFDDLPQAFSMEKDYLERFVDRGLFSIFETDGFFLDIGIPEDYVRAQTAFLDRVPCDTHIAFFDRDGTINVDTGHLFEPEKLELIPETIALMQGYRARDYVLVVVTNQAGIAKGLYTEEDMRALHRVLNAQLTDLGAAVDAFYFCPHHPDFTGSCSCRKPGGGMIEKALFDYEADPADCILYGDKLTDIDAAESCGVEAKLV